MGILGVHAVMLVWDQCFLSNWKHNVMENTCLVILQLLRVHILEAEGYIGIRKSLLDQPSELFTLDVQKGLSYLHNGGALIDVGSLRQCVWLSHSFSFKSLVAKGLDYLSYNQCFHLVCWSKISIWWSFFNFDSKVPN